MLRKGTKGYASTHGLGQQSADVRPSERPNSRAEPHQSSALCFAEEGVRNAPSNKRNPHPVDPQEALPGNQVEDQ